MTPVRASVESDESDLGRTATRLLRDAGVRVAERGGIACMLATGTVSERLERIAESVARRPGVPVVTTLPAGAGGGALRRALRIGVHGIVLDGQLGEALVPTVRAVSAGQLVVPTALRRQLAPDALSHREKQVMGLVAVGYTNRQIAAELFLAESTVKTHLSSAFTKLDARSRAEAAALLLDAETGYGASILDVVGKPGQAAA